MATLVDVDTFRKVLDLPVAVATDEDLTEVLDATEAALLPHLAEGPDYSTNPSVREAALGMSVQVWQSRHAPGGQMVGVDLNPQQTPHLLGPGLLMRYQGLLGPFMRYGGAVVA